MRKLIRRTYNGIIYDLRTRRRLRSGEWTDPPPPGGSTTFLPLIQQLELGAQVMDLEKGKNGSVFGIVNRLLLDLS